MDRKRTDELTVEIVENLRAALQEERMKVRAYQELITFLIDKMASMLKDNLRKPN